MKRIVLPLAAALLLLVAYPLRAQDTAKAARPNILLILTDDQGWPTLGCYGGKFVKTPNLDQLAAAGTRFTNAYVTSQCTPTRATLLTGQYTARNGLWHVLAWYGYPYSPVEEPMFAEELPRSRFTIAKGLRAAGYKTAIMGKWHLSTNADGGYRGLKPEVAGEFGFDYAPPLLPNSEFAEGADRGVEKLTDQALEFIEKNREHPWFCYLAHHMIHGKVVAPEPIVQKYRDRGYGDKGPNRAVYLAGLECIDRSVGRLMKRLKELGEAEETLVIFISDNGGVDEKLDFANLPKPNPPAPVFQVEEHEYDNAPLRAGKGSTYEGGIRVPMIVHWPGHVRQGAEVDTPVHAIDILPTCFQVAGAQAPATHTLDGKSLATLLKTGKDPSLASRPLYQYYPFYDLRWGLTPNASIRVGDYKLIEFFGDRVDAENRYVAGHTLELYNLRQDIGETRNLAAEEPGRTKQLHDQLRGWMQSIGAARPPANPHHEVPRAFFETRTKPDWLKDAVWKPKH